MERLKRSVSFNGQSDVLKEIMFSLTGFRTFFRPPEPRHFSNGTDESIGINSQVDWSEVVLDVIGKERPAIFRDAFKKILQVRIEELLKQEDKQETENMNEPDIESADDIVDWAGNGLADFEEKISMQRDEENEHGSKGYEDDEDEEEDVADEDSEKDDGEEDGEYQEDDDDYEAIADEVSV